MPLKVRLKAGEHVVVNGALIKVDNPVTLVLVNHARFMLDRQIMRPEEASTPARRIYFSVQNTYLASDEELPGMLQSQQQFIRDFFNATRNAEVRAKLEQIEQLVQVQDFYQALQLARDVMRYEDAVLGHAPHGANEDAGRPGKPE